MRTPSWIRRLGASREPRLNLLAVTSKVEDRATFSVASISADWDLTVASSCEEAVRRLNGGCYPVIVCDRELPGFDWRDVMEILVRSAKPAACVILISPVNDGFLWQEVIRLGGYDVLSRPLRRERLTHAVNLAWSYWKATKAKAGVTR